MLSPSSGAKRGEAAIQPSYFTSWAYVTPLRQDIANLVADYEEQYIQSPTTKPFSLFKALWTSQGWPWLHLKIVDARSRDVFLAVTMRLFLESLLPTKNEMTRAVALVGLYIFFNTQPKDVSPTLHRREHIAIPIDEYIALLSLPKALHSEPRLELMASDLVNKLTSSKAFHILPSSELGAQNPRHLPREVLQAPCVEEEPKKGRQTKRAKANRAKAAVESLDKWMQKTDPPSNVPKPTLFHYQSHKVHLLGMLDPTSVPVSMQTKGRVAIEQGNQEVMERMKHLEELKESGDLAEVDSRFSFSRVKRAVEECHTRDLKAPERRGGLLSLLEGAGITHDDRAVL
ncbi:hypothetical protein C8J56DRAFT_299611 [Mycena floridula]|nr:hypothetical protein C8J56DRAFT_299611 [Mycena floridula]